MFDFFKRKTKVEKQQTKDLSPKALELLSPIFEQLSSSEQSPYMTALTAFKGVEETAKDREELLYFLMSDIIFTALHTTVMEDVLETIRSNPEYSIELVNKFSSDTEERDELINEHTSNHLRFILQGGECDGCESCEGHADILHLVDRWREQDQQFFTKLYLEVQTIYCFLELVLIKVIPHRLDVAEVMSKSTIESTRNYLAQFIEQKIRTA